MIKKQQKWIALLVTLTFLWLLQASTMPVAAAGATEQIAAASAEQAPGFIEQEGASGYQAKKKSILPVILIGLGVVAVAAVLILVVFKTKYDPVGTWSGPMSNQVPQNWTTTIVFAGDKKTGTVLYKDPWYSNQPGTYTVGTGGAKNITFIVTISGQTITFTGAFETKDIMSGTWNNPASTLTNGPWKLTRNASTTHMPVPQDAAGIKGMLIDK